MTEKIMPIVCPRLNDKIEAPTQGLQAVIKFSKGAPNRIMCGQYLPPRAPNTMDSLLGEKEEIFYGMCKRGEDGNKDCIYAKWEIFKLDLTPEE